VMRWHGRCAALAGHQRRAVARRTLATRRLGQVVLCGVNSGSEFACGWRGDATLRAGGDLRRRCCAEVAGAVRVWLGTAVRADGRCRGLVRRGLERARGRTGRPGRRACTRVSERAGCGVARLCSWRRGVHGSASVCTHVCAGCGACTRAGAAASCCCAGGRGGPRGARCGGPGACTRGEEGQPGRACSGRRKGREGRARGEREEREERFAPDPRRAVGHAQRRSPVLGRVRARGKGEQGDGYGCRVGSSGGRAEKGLSSTTQNLLNHFIA